MNKSVSELYYRNFQLKKIHPLACAISCLLPLASVSSLSFASGVSLEEMLVTAERREENQQQVPVAITAFTGADLEQKAIATIADLEKSAPNTQLRPSRATSSTLTAYVRGVGQQDPLWGFEPGVGVYVDDVYYARPQAAVMDVFDVERIEVLRGPQGTLYGKNTVGGAIKYVTKPMEGETTGKVSLGFGSYGQQDIMLSGQVPLAENKLYIGAAVASLQRDGYGEVQTGYDINSGTFSDTEENYNKDVIVGRLSVEYTPIEQLSLRFSADKTNDESNSVCGSQSSPTSVINPGTGSAFDIGGDRYDSACGTTHEGNVENQGYSLTARYDATESLSLKYIFADREGETQQFIDFEATPLDAFDVPASYSDEQRSHEFQVNFTNEMMALVGGVYYFEGNSAGAFDVVLNSDPFFDGSHLDLGVGGDVDTESLSFFINGSFYLTQSLTLTAGLRQTEDEKNSNIRNILMVTANSFPGTTTQGSGFTFGNPSDDTVISVSTDISDDEANADWDELSPSVKLDWQATEDVMLYVSYAEGFKSGGFDMRGNASLNPGVSQGYDPETVKTYEIGVKSQFFNDRIRVNAAAFDMDYDDMQLTVQQAQPAPIFFSSDVLNAGTAEISGFEIEMVAQLTQGLNTSLSAGYLDTDLVEVISGGVDVSDSWDLLNAPDWTAQFALNYDLELGDLGNLIINGAISHRGASRNFNNVTCTCDQTESYQLFDLGATWYSNGGNWTAGLHVKNLTDEEYKTGGYNLGSGELAFYGPPRIATARLSYQF